MGITSTATATIAPEVIGMAKHHREMSAAFSLGVDCIGRLGTMIDAAIALVKTSIPDDYHQHLILKFLKECDYIGDDLSSMLESERDSQLEYAARQEVK